jgi:hypothetical protein
MNLDQPALFEPGKVLLDGALGQAGARGNARHARPTFPLVVARMIRETQQHELASRR